MKSKLVIRTTSEQFIQTIDCPKIAMDRVKHSLNVLFSSLGLNLVAMVEEIQE